MSRSRRKTTLLSQAQQDVKSYDSMFKLSNKMAGLPFSVQDVNHKDLR